MKIPPSSHFTPIDLGDTFNACRADLPDTMRTPKPFAEVFGDQTLQGIPFAMANDSQATDNVLLLAADAIAIPVDDVRSGYLLFLHVVEDRKTSYQTGFADSDYDGNELGQTVSTYTIEYDDGSSHTTPIVRRFAIQQARTQWGAAAFAAIPALEPLVTASAGDDRKVNGATSLYYGKGETRHTAGRDLAGEHLWLYALPNPFPEKTITRIVCAPGEERSAIYAVTAAPIADHPLRPGTRRKLRLALPDGASLNAIGELEDVAIDLGTVISARAVLDYDVERWLGRQPNQQPEQSTSSVVIEYIAHPLAKLYVGIGSNNTVALDLADLTDRSAGSLAEIPPADRPVRLRVVDKDSGRPVAVRLHLHGSAGEYLPPRGYHRKVNPYWFEDTYAEHVSGQNQFAYIDGECLADLPLGDVYVELSRGYEVSPIRTRFEVTAETDEIRFELEKVLDWRERGWVTADTHVHFLSPQTALLEGKAEGVNVVNLLASQWGEMFSNVGDFDGRTTIGAKEFGGDGEFVVRVGTENRMQVLGHISLLGYSGQMIHPLCSGGPSESAIGDPLEVTMAEWAKRCIDQNGLVVMPHAPNPQLERAADIVLGVVNAIEMMTFNPLTPDANQINPYGVADWYRYLNLGYQVPVVGGSDKMAAASLLGGIRTYAHMGEREFTYENWMEAVRAGNTFVTVGPLAELTVEGIAPGGTLELPASGGTVNITWRVESVSLPIEQVEVVASGLVVDQVNAHGALSIEGSVELGATTSTWVALRVRGSYTGRPEQIAAHTSAVQVSVGRKGLFSQADALTVLEQIEGAIAYVDTLAPRPEAIRYKQLRATLESAHNRLHQRMHRAGVYHQHTPLHDHEHPREH